MRTSERGRKFIEDQEWNKRTARCGWDEAKQLYFKYKDYRGNWTFGPGLLVVRGDDYSAGMTEEQVYRLFDAKLTKYEQAVEDNVKVELEQHEFDALVCFCWNLGVGWMNPERNTAVRMLNIGRRDLVPHLLEAFDMADGVHDPNLKKRRIAEGYVFSHPYPASDAPQEDHDAYDAPLFDLMPLAASSADHQ